MQTGTSANGMAVPVQEVKIEDSVIRADRVYHRREYDNEHPAIFPESLPAKFICLQPRRADHPRPLHGQRHHAPRS